MTPADQWRQWQIRAAITRPILGISAHLPEGDNVDLTMITIRILLPYKQVSTRITSIIFR